MAYRRRHGMSRASTFKEEILHKHDDHDHDHDFYSKDKNIIIPTLSSSFSFTSTPHSSASSSLAAQAIRASAARCDPSLSFSHDNHHDHHIRSKSADHAYEEDASKSGFWGVIAQKAKEILEDDNASSQPQPQPQSQHRDDDHHHQDDDDYNYDDNKSNLKSHSFNATQTNHKTEDHLITPICGLKIMSPDQDASWSPWQQPAQIANSQTINQTQLKASRDVAMATAAKAKLLLRELKTVKADLAFSKARCAQLEEENKLLRAEGREKGGQTRADDDLIRLQLETLLAEKGRLANENEMYARENRFLRETVEYHQLTMQEVLYIEEDDDIVEPVELYHPIDNTSNSNLRKSPRSPLAGRPKTIFPVPQDQDLSKHDS
ncbi:hypothetical protein RJT34_22429 [Clitoria ternatea]|uniref:Uncharacterized protein n=1 Tax=Clitoria ternatea TaxID=43366 RepID=A0AAN9IX09_CLITE